MYSDVVATFSFVNSKYVLLLRFASYTLIGFSFLDPGEITNVMSYKNTNEKKRSAHSASESMNLSKFHDNSFNYSRFRHLNVETEGGGDEGQLKRED